MRRCGGLPLALELVAAQLAAMPVGDLVDHFDEVIVEGDDQLRSVARSSYVLLDADEAAVFRRLAVLDGPVGAALVRQVVAGGPIAEVRVVRILRELTARGLLTVDRSGTALALSARRRLALAMPGSFWSTPARSGRCSTGSPTRFARRCPKMPARRRRLSGAGLRHARAQSGRCSGLPLAGRADVGRCLELAFRLHRYFAATNVAEGRFWLGRLLAIEPDSSVDAVCDLCARLPELLVGRHLNAVQQLRTAVDSFVGVDDSYVARAMIYLAGLLDDLDRGPEAVDYVRRAIAAAAPFGTDLQVSAAMGMGSVLAERGDPAAAGYAHDAIELCRAGRFGRTAGVGDCRQRRWCAGRSAPTSSAAPTSRKPVRCTQRCGVSPGLCCCAPQPASPSPRVTSTPPSSSVRKPSSRRGNWVSNGKCR